MLKNRELCVFLSKLLTAVGLIGSLPAVASKPVFNITAKPVVQVTIASPITDHDDISSSPLGLMYQRALILGLEEISKSKELNHIELKWKQFNLPADVQNLQRFADQGLKDKPNVLIGPVFSSDTLLFAKILENKKYKPLFLSPAATAKDLKKFNHFLLATALPNPKQGQYLAQQISKPAKVAAITAVDCIYCVDLKNAFKKSLKSQNITEFKVLSSDLEFDKLVENLKQDNWDYILLPNYELLNARLIRVLSQSKINVGQYLGGDGWGKASQAFNDIAGREKFTAQTISHWLDDGAKKLPKEAKLFHDNYLKKYGQSPSEVSALAYNSILALKELLKNWNGRNQKDLMKLAQSNFEFNGLLGKVRIRKAKVEHAPYVLNKYKYDELSKSIKQLGQVVQ